MDAMRITVWEVGRDLGLAGCHVLLRTYVFSFSCPGTSTYFVTLVQPNIGEFVFITGLFIVFLTFFTVKAPF